ncbi:MAG: hypothetical protein ACRCXZ_07675 [Patescibacteria group bacterium]
MLDINKSRKVKVIENKGGFYSFFGPIYTAYVIVINDRLFGLLDNTFTGTVKEAKDMPTY